jgi:hypothetical protein
MKIPIWIQNQKNKKKEAKISCGYSEKQVQALRVFKKISTQTVPKHNLILTSR